MINNRELVPLKKHIETLADKVNHLTINNELQLKLAVEVLSKINAYADSVKSKKELITKPLNLALKNARAMFAPIEDTYEGAIESLRQKMQDYQTEQVRIKQQAELKIAERVREGKGNLTVETAVKKIAELKPIEKEVATESGLVQFRETRILKITNPLLIPREYLIVDESKLLKALKDGKTVVGAELETIQVPVNYR